MERKYPLLLLGAPNKRGIVFPKKAVEEAVENYKKRLEKSGEKISGELSYREKDLISAVVAVPNEKGEILIWDDLVIEGDFLYGILSKESQELLNEAFPNEAWSFLLRAHYKLNTRLENDKVIQEITELNVLAIDKYVDENEIILN